MIRVVVVVVPAADEQDEIGGCLSAIERAIAELQSVLGVAGHVVVALDACRDDTAKIVAGFPRVHSAVCHARRVGAARRAGVSAALDRWGPPEQLWLASTDADCRVPSNWLTEMISAARSSELVLGTVRPANGLAHSVERAWYDAHVLDDDHGHIHGANLGMIASAYLRVGGWNDLAVHEDVDLVERAVAAGVRVNRTGAAPVATSSRLVGRAPDGFAAYLRALHSKRRQSADHRRSSNEGDAADPVTVSAPEIEERAVPARPPMLHR